MSAQGDRVWSWLTPVLLLSGVAAGVLTLVRRRRKGAHAEVGDTGDNLDTSDTGEDVEAAWEQHVQRKLADSLGWLYWWGKGGPSAAWKSGASGVDCSGFVSMALVRLGFMSVEDDRLTSASVAAVGREIPLGDQRPGDVVLYPHHAVLVWSMPDESGDSRVIGASGGTRETFGDNPEAKVKTKPSIYSHGDPLGIYRFGEPEDTDWRA